MSDEFQLGSGNWWDGARNRYDSSGGSTAAPASTALNNNNNNNNNSFGWQTEMVDIKGRSSMDSASSVSMGLVFPTDSHRLQLHDSSSSSSGAAASGVNLLTDPNLHMMGLGLSSQTMDWNQPLFRGEKGENSFRSMLQEGEGNANFEQDSQEQQWRHKLLFGGGNSSGDQDDDDSSVTHHHHHHHHHFKQFNRTVGGLSLDHHHQQQQPQYSSSQSSNNNNSTAAAATNFHVVDSAPPYGNNSPNVLQGLLVSADNNNNSYSYPPPPPMDNSSYIMNHHQQQHLIIPSSSSNSWSKFPHQFFRTSSSSSSSPPAAAKQQQPPPSAAGAAHAQLHFSNNTPFWNAISTPNTDATRSSCSFFPSLHQTQQLTTSSSSFEEKPKQSTSEVRDFTKKSSTNTEASNKRSRNETTPSTMPAFKVRKEKMGDRITALQQLVSPFGKTDTASVLSEAIEYIKFLHEQVSVLSTPYMKSGAHVQHPPQIPHEKSNNKDPEGPKQDLRSRGLCLVPVPSTFPVMNESNFDFWNPTFGGTYR